MSRHPYISRSIATLLSSGLVVVLLNQACGNFSPTAGSAEASSRSADQFQIVSLTNTLRVGSNLQFGFNGQTVSSSAGFKWNHKLNGSATGCTELTSNSGSSYVINCAQEGQLEVELSITDSPDSFGPYRTNFVVGSSVSPTPSSTPPSTATPRPDPAPTSTPQQSAGAVLYETHCTGCHYSIQSSNIRGRSSLMQIQNAIRNQRQMRGYTFLTTAELQAISDALR